MNKVAKMARGNRWRELAARTIAAVPLNYAVTTALTMLVARLLPGGPQQASLGATMLSFAIFAAIAMTTFAVRSVLKLWAVLIGVGLVAGALDWLLIMWGGRL
jgi:hypothetical protein